jgi:Fur family ferric uptake transcriptional regulator
MDEWEQHLSEAGYRITEPRRAVMQVLLKANAPLSPQEILADGETIYSNLGLTTVYRTVALFEDLELARRVHRDDGCHGYVATTPGHRHHVICRHCGRVVEFAGSEDLEALIARVEARTDYRVVDHLLQLFGLCPECRGRSDG